MGAENHTKYARRFIMAKTLNTRPLIWAHRGASAYAPENTLPAFRLAVEMHADGVELDVYLTKDDQIVVCHDNKIDRTSTGCGLISEHTLEELRAYSFHNAMAGFENTPIPTLAEVYALLAPTTLSVNVEIKSRDSRLPAMCCDLAKQYGMEDRVYYSSFYHPALLAVHDVNPYLPVAPLFDCNLVYPWLYASTFGAQAIHPHHGAFRITPEIIRECHMRGIRVNFWTCDDPEIIDTLAKAGCDAVITNKPDVAIEVLKRAGLYE
jgi:glycerophosphoryl diester phosphodiesterase